MVNPINFKLGQNKIKRLIWVTLGSFQKKPATQLELHFNFMVVGGKVTPYGYHSVIAPRWAKNRTDQIYRVHVPGYRRGVREKLQELETMGECKVKMMTHLSKTSWKVEYRGMDTPLIYKLRPRSRWHGPEGTLNTMDAMSNRTRDFGAPVIWSKRFVVFPGSEESPKAVCGEINNSKTNNSKLTIKTSSPQH